MAYVTRHLGRIGFLFFLINIISGVMLAFYFRPASPYSSVSYIMENVEFGLLTRSVHSWSSYLLVLLMFTHMVRGVLRRGYRVSEKSWIVGSLMGLIILVCSFTGYLLIWDQRAYWATVIGINTMETVPYIGGPLKIFLLGGPEVVADTVGRFYALHTLVLPALAIALMILHIRSLNQLWRFLLDFMRRIGILGSIVKGKLEEMDSTALSNLLLEVLEVFVVFEIILVLALLFPPGIGERANPLITPAQVKPEWYFLFVYQGLKYAPKVVGVTFFFVILPILIISLPLIDRGLSPALHPQKRRLLATILILLALTALFTLTILGWLA